MNKPIIHISDLDKILFTVFITIIIMLTFALYIKTLDVRLSSTIDFKADGYFNKTIGNDTIEVTHIEGTIEIDVPMYKIISPLENIEELLNV